MVLMLKWYDQPHAVTQFTEIINYVFAAIFALEAIIKIIALGKLYFKDSWNLFDLTVVLITIITIVIQQVTVVNIGA